MGFVQGVRGICLHRQRYARERWRSTDGQLEVVGQCCATIVVYDRLHQSNGCTQVIVRNGAGLHVGEAEGDITVHIAVASDRAGVARLGHRGFAYYVAASVEAVLYARDHLGGINEQVEVTHHCIAAVIVDDDFGDR